MRLGAPIVAALAVIMFLASSVLMTNTHLAAIAGANAAHHANVDHHAMRMSSMHDVEHGDHADAAEHDHAHECCDSHQCCIGVVQISPSLIDARAPFENQRMALSNLPPSQFAAPPEHPPKRI